MERSDGAISQGGIVSSLFLDFKFDTLYRNTSIILVGSNLVLNLIKWVINDP